MIFTLNYATAAYFIIVIAILGLFQLHRGRREAGTKINHKPYIISGLALSLCAVLISSLWGFTSEPFVYGIFYWAFWTFWAKCLYTALQKVAPYTAKILIAVTVLFMVAAIFKTSYSLIQFTNDDKVCATNIDHLEEWNYPNALTKHANGEERCVPSFTLRPYFNAIDYILNKVFGLGAISSLFLLMLMLAPLYLIGRELRSPPHSTPKKVVDAQHPPQTARKNLKIVFIVTAGTLLLYSLLSVFYVVFTEPDNFTRDPDEYTRCPQEFYSLLAGFITVKAVIPLSILLLPWFFKKRLEHISVQHMSQIDKVLYYISITLIVFMFLFAGPTIISAMQTGWPDDNGCLWR